ncbi:Hypothetical protein NTJ_08761 [Nesidiocoris tenuis]|uniref:Uncharacterized protein n=1 Tax=Nesidiocoris tenuis TaxID=355587 RepID=A0ABN7AUU4_9HEMI|nr:Hypothetical protein NTJ_08761 [Nesidiocoris tenuis]
MDGGTLSGRGCGRQGHKRNGEDTEAAQEAINEKNPESRARKDGKADFGWRYLRLLRGESDRTRSCRSPQ